MTLRLFPFWLLIALLLASCGSDPAQQYDLPDKPKPALWEVQRDGEAVAWLFGTIHMLPDGIDWQTARFEQAMDASASLLLEIDLANGEDSAALLRKMAQDEPVAPIRKRLGEVPRKRFGRLERTGKADESVFDPMESWAAALMLARVNDDKLGISHGSGVEQQLRARFRASGKPINGLERTIDQFRRFDSLPEATQDDMLNRSLESVDDARADLQKLMAAWASGDTDALTAIGRDGLLGQSELHRALLERPNRLWAERIAERANPEKPPFVAVGASHLVGEGSIIELLEQRPGWTVKRLQ